AWYYAEGDKAVGPVTLADLIAILSRVSDGQSIFVWRAGLADWVQAKNLPELAPHVTKPPPLPRRPVSGWQMALRKRYRDFRLALIPHAPDRFKAQELEPTWSRAIRVWWLFCWRYLVGYIAIYAIVVWPISVGLQAIQIQNWVILFTVSFG